MDESSAPLLSLDSETADDDVETNDRSLPANKDYHVFISYSSEDKEFVKTLHQHLEENLKFRCMVAERDFTIGAPVMDNISEAMDRSEKALFVVSTNFLNSEFCKREVDFAHIFAIDNKHQNYAIILKIDDCQLDRKMRICTYIDGSDRDIEAIGHKLEMAYSAGHGHLGQDDKQSSSPSSSVVRKRCSRATS
ncbi:toll-like receptor 2 [Argopecten irradians]|uniref:toll-like receptor 2 n=1 Tax=Argopecten irradians TaxID=31199 RepID=UPI0037181E45